MIEVRQDSSQQSKSCVWIKNFVGVILAALLLLVVFKELHSSSLSKDMDESRKLLKELSGRMAEIEKENENLRKELRHIKAKTRLQVFANMQKVSRVRRSHKDGHVDRCKKWHHCFNKGFNCSMIKNCISSRGKGLLYEDYIHVFILLPLRNESLPAGDRTVKLPWKEYIPKKGNIVYLTTDIVIFTRGLYFVYCHLRVGELISRVFIWKGDSVLFSSRPTFTIDTVGNRYGAVQMFGLVDIHHIPKKGARLYVQVEFYDEFEARKGLNRTIEGMAALFPDYNRDKGAEYDIANAYNARSPDVPDRNINSFGAFLVAKTKAGN